MSSFEVYFVVECEPCGMHRGGGKKGVDVNAEEKAVYKKELACLESALEKCGDDIVCKVEIKTQIKLTQDEIESR